MTSTRQPHIIWTKDRNGNYHAHFGGLLVGGAGARDDGSAFWSIDAVHMKWIAKGRDLHAPSLDSATKALERAWAIWLERSGLILRSDFVAMPDPIWGDVVPNRPK